jgi:hypothetical protein
MKKISLSNWSKDEEKFNKERLELFSKNYQSYFDNPFLLTTRQSFSVSLARIKIYELVKSVKGSIVECGVHQGNGLLLFYHLLLCNEPTSFNDKVIGFDTFEGFRSISKKDDKKIKKTDFSDTDYNHLKKLIELNQLNDLIKHIPRVQLIKGDAVKTIPKYKSENKSLIIKLLYLDFDLYKPTLVALNNFYELVPSGGVVVFDEMGNEKFVGETLAFKEFFKNKSVELKKFEFEPWISYFIKK